MKALFIFYYLSFHMAVSRPRKEIARSIANQTQERVFDPWKGEQASSFNSQNGWKK